MQDNQFKDHNQPRMMSMQMKLIQRVEHFTVFESMPSTSCYNYDSVFSHKKSHMIVFQYPCYCISLVKLPKCESYSSTISTSISKRFQLRTTPTSWTTGVNHSITKLTNLGLYIISIVKHCNTYKISNTTGQKFFQFIHIFRICTYVILNVAATLLI